LNPPGNDKSSDDALEYGTASVSDQLFRSSLQYSPTGMANTRRRPMEAIGVPAAGRHDGFALLYTPSIATRPEESCRAKMRLDDGRTQEMRKPPRIGGLGGGHVGAVTYVTRARTLGHAS
jgi:hypothetical protein